MKKILFGMSAIAMLLATSCQKDADLDFNVGETSVVSFNVATPQLATRAYSDGSTANKLQYAVYDVDGNILDGLTETNATINGSTTVNLQLTTGNTYSVLFWAAAEDAPYSVDLGNKTMEVDYTAAITLSNDEKRDAFYKYHTFTVTGAQSEDVELKRPFAQLNIGTNDYAAAKSAGYEPTLSSVTVKDVYTTLDFATGEVDRKTAVTFDYYAIPTDKDFPVDGYDYLAMNYVLVDAEKDVVDIVFGYTESDAAAAKTRTVGSVPVQRNYRTNIYGSLLTSTVDVNVVIEPEYEENDKFLEAWDGTSLNEPTYDDATKTYYISHAAELAYIAALVNGTLDTDNVTRAAVAADGLKGKTISLECDINLNGKEWTPIGMGGKHFQGTLKGNNCTIHGLTITERPNATSQAALFGTVSGTVNISDLTIKGASIEGTSYTDEDFYGSALIGTAYGNVTIENVNVIDSYISGNNKVGALLAHDGVVSSLNISNCNVSNVVFETTNVADGGLVGGLVGFFQGVADNPSSDTYGKHHIYNSTVKGCTFNVVNSTNNGKRANGQLMGGILSNAGQILYIDQCSVANNTWNEKFYNGGTEVTTGTYESIYGELVGGERNDAPKGEVYIDGELVEILTPIENCEGVALDAENNYVIIAAVGFSELSALVAADDNNFAGKTVMLNADIDLKSVSRTNAKIGDSDAPIGSTGERDDRGRLICEPFKGTFDGQGHTIKNLYQSGWDMGYEWGQYGSIGLFAELENATVKNVVIESMEAQVEGGDISFIAGSATGDCVFEDITIKNSSIGTYNNGCGGIIGWSGAGTYTFKNITLESDVVLGGLWGSFDSSIGGVVGQAEPGATYNFENVTINCRIDAYNDCTASYDYYNYRMCGMIIGRCQKTTTIDGKNYPDLSKYNMTFTNVTVNYGDWMNYHYCRKSGERAVRVEPGYAYGGVAADRDHSTDNVHCMECIPFDQLIGGDQYAVKGLREVDGVTVNYPASYNTEN